MKNYESQKDAASEKHDNAATLKMPSMKEFRSSGSDIYLQQNAQGRLNTNGNERGIDEKWKADIRERLKALNVTP